MTYCATCGAPVEGAFCGKCGASANAANPAPGPQSAGASPAGASAMSDNVASALCYVLGFITGILFLVLAPYSTNRNVRFHAFQSILMNVATIVLWFGLIFLSIVLHVIPVLGTILSILISFGFGLGVFLLWLYMIYKAYSNEKVVLPVVGPMAEKQAQS